MKQLFVLALGFVISASALAYKDGTYSCKNVEGLPNNTYKVSTSSVAGTGVPFLEIEKYYNLGDSPMVHKSEIRGFASIIKTDDGVEQMVIGALHLEFHGDELFGCKK